MQSMLRNSNLMPNWRNLADRLSRSPQQLLTNHNYVPTFVFAFTLVRLVPCSSHNLLCYVVFLAQTLAASSITCHLNVVRILHLQCGFSNPLQDPLFKFHKELLMRGIKRLHSNVLRQKRPITPDILHKLHRQLDLTNSLDATFWATGDIHVYNWGLMLLVCWSKTIQYRNRTLLVPVLKIDHSKLCLHRAIVHAFKSLASHDSAKLQNSPDFVHTSGDQVKPLTYTTFTTKLKKLLEQCGFNSSQYSGHSFRCGGATFALNCGVRALYLNTSLQYKIIAVHMMSKSITHWFSHHFFGGFLGSIVYGLGQ